MPWFPWPQPSFQRIARFAPIIGLIIGAIESIFWILLSICSWPLPSIAILTVIINIILTGGLHIDGLMDTADGIMAEKKRFIEAMKDSRSGAFGIQALLIVVLIQIAALIKLGSLAPIALPIATVWGRFSQLFAINNFPYLHKDKFSLHHENWIGLKEFYPFIYLIIIITLLIFLIPIDLINSYKILLFIIFSSIPSLSIPHFLGNYLGGHSGDTYGATLVSVETSILFLLAFIL